MRGNHELNVGRQEEMQRPTVVTLYAHKSFVLVATGEVTSHGRLFASNLVAGSSSIC
jgi:hypothetical protein